MVAAAKFRVYQRCVCTDVIFELLDQFIGWGANNFGGCGLGETLMRESTLVMVVWVGGISGTPWCAFRYCRTDNGRKMLMLIKTFYNNL